MDNETPKQKDPVHSKPMNKHAPPSIENMQKDFAATCDKSEEDALKEVAGHVKSYSDDMLKKWNQEIDNLLVFAGLFSSALTGFNVQSYLLLQPSTPDPILVVLQQISLQLSSFSVNPPGALVNSTHPAAFSAVQSSPVEPWAVWLNSLWFSALICSLSASAVAILVKQWIHTLKYQSGLSGDSLEFARLRQYRLNHWKTWHVPEIIALLPTLLQISLFLFFSGILILLWHYHSVVAIVASILIGTIVLFVVGTTILPIFCAHCCYLSPPVYPLYVLMQSAKHSFIWLCDMLLKGILICCDYVEKPSKPFPTSNPSTVPSVSKDSTPVAHTAAPSTKGSIVSKLKRFTVSNLRQWAFTTALPKRIPLTLRERDQDITLNSSASLHVDMLAYAFATTVDAKLLFNNARIILDNGRATADNLSTRLYSQIKDVNQEHFHTSYSTHSTPPDICAGELVYSYSKVDDSKVDDSNIPISFLFNERIHYYPDMKDVTCQRLLLALVATLTKQNPLHVAMKSLPVDGSQDLSPEWDGYTKSLTVLEELFTLQPAPLALESMPWNAVSYVIEASEFSLYRLLSDVLLVGTETNKATHDLLRDVVVQWLRILVRCCLAPVESWNRLPEQMQALNEYLPKFATLVLKSVEDEPLLLNLWEEIFSFKSSALTQSSMPWVVLEPVVKLAETRLNEFPNKQSVSTEPDQQLDQLRNTVLTFQSLRIWIWCRFMPVSSWKESQSKMGESVFDTIKFSILDQKALIHIAKNLGDWPNAEVMLQILGLLLLYMSCSKNTRDGAWKLVPDNFLKSVEDIIEIGRTWSTAEAVFHAKTESTAAAAKLKASEDALKAAEKARTDAKTSEATAAANPMETGDGIESARALVQETEKRIGEAQKDVETAKAMANAATAAATTANTWHPLHDELEELAHDLAICKELQSRTSDLFDLGIVLRDYTQSGV